MSKQGRTTLKSFFNQGDVPTEGNYVDLIDSPIIMDEQNDGDILTSGIVSASGTGSNFFQTMHITGSGDSASFGRLVLGKAFQYGTGEDFIGIGYGTGSSLGAIDHQLNIQNAPFIYNGDSDQLFLQSVTGGGKVSIRTTTNTDDPVDHFIIQSSSITTETPITSSADIFTSGSIIVNGTISNINTTHVTASGNISSSGTIIANNFTSTGDNVGGINFSDGVLITGSITASNSISSSLTGSFAQLESLKFIGSRPIGTIGENTTLSLQHIGTYNRCGAHVVTIPLNSAVAFPVGTEIEFIQTVSSGHLLITASYSEAVTLNSRHNLLSASGQFSAISCKKVATDEWDIIGDLTK
mgnify:CR=1 FL=1